MNVEYTNDYISVISDGTGENKYYYLSEPFKVCILPYIYKNDDLKIVALIEPISIWGRSKEISCVQGTIDDGENPVETAPRELFEETGFEAPLPENKDRYTYLGKFNFSKSSDSERHLFLCDVTDLKRGKKTTDGSLFEKKTKIIIGSPDLLQESTDATLHFLYRCLEQKLSL